jgi:hypothetical protein
MKKLLMGLILVLTLIIGVELSYAQDNSQAEANRIKEVCSEYYNQGIDCPYDSVDGVPIMINGDDEQYQRFDGEEVEVEKPQFKSN